MRASFRWGLAAVAAAVVVVAAHGGPPADAGRPRVDPLVELGRRLFFDPAISRSGDNSCASCHDPAHAFSSARRLDVDDFSLTRRHSQTLLDVTDGKSFHWDGEFATVEELVTARLTATGSGSYRSSPPPSTPGVPNPEVSAPKRRSRGTTGGAGPRVDLDRPSPEVTPPEAAAGDEGAAALASALELAAEASRAPAAPLAHRGTDVAGNVERHGRYAEAFRHAFGSPRVTVARIAKAVAAYVATIRSGESAYDRFVAGDEGALSAPARRGLALFAGRAGCAECHVMKGRRAAFTDYDFHNTGVSARADALLRRPVVLTPPTFLSGTMESLRRFVASAPVLPEAAFGGFDDGRFGLTGTPRHRGAFKTPTLRDVAVRAPYMHDGAFATLESVVRYYARGGHLDEHLDPRIRRFEASDGDVADLVAFLRALSSDLPAALAPDYERRAKATVLRVVDPMGRPLAGLAIHAEPVGDRLPGDGTVASRAVEATTDLRGRVALAPARTSHWRVVVPPGVRVDGGAWIPDTCAEATLVVSTVGRATLLLGYPEGVEPAASLRAFAEARRLSTDDRDRLRAAAPGVLDAVRRDVATFVRVGRVDVGGRAQVRYEAWLDAEAPALAHLDVALPERRVTVPVALAPDRETRHDLVSRAPSDPSR